MAEYRLGTIRGYLGNWQSGIGVLLIQDDDGTVPQQVFCESGPTGRALIAAFDCAGEGHTIDNSKLKGQRVYYQVDTLGMLEFFIKEADFDPSMEENSSKQE